MIRDNEPLKEKNSLFSIGVDIEHVHRFKRERYDYEDLFFSRIYSLKELEYCFTKNDPSIHLAGKFACKEATIKALTQKGIFISDLKTIEVLNGLNKAPYINLDIPESEKISSSASISHTDGIAIATVIVWF